MEKREIFYKLVKGKYPVDILAIADNGERVIIENPYFKTDHIHIGEIMTYAAWHDASTVVWIAEDVDKEHFKAVEYINELAAEKIFKFWLLLAKPNMESINDNNPRIELREVTINDIKERDNETFKPKNAELNIAF